MSQDLVAVGTKLGSLASPVEVIVVRPPAQAAVIACCGVPMTATAGVGPSGKANSETGNEAEAVVLGKRYSDEGSGLELLCTRPGQGPLTYDGRPLLVKGSKPLPASD